jgi:phosphoglycolate phosphatase
MNILIFDFDGVIFDTTAMAEEYLRSQYPNMTTEIQKELLVGNFHEELQKYRSTLEPRIETKEQKEARQSSYAEVKLNAEMYDGVHELLLELHKKGYILVLNTSAMERNCLPMLTRAGIEHVFDFVATAETSKSKVDKFKIIEQKYAVNPEDMLFITDTLGDVREADIAGVPTVAVTWGAHDHTFFNREPHQNLKAIVDSVEELKGFIYTYAVSRK